MKPLEDQIRPTHIKGEAPTYIQGQGIRLGVKEGINEDTRENEESVSNTNLEKIIPPPSYTSSSTTHEKEQKPNKSYHRNLKQIFILAFNALRERKARSILTILMVVAGGGLMIALNGMSAGVASLINKQLSILAPNVLFVSPGKINFRG